MKTLIVLILLLTVVPAWAENWLFITKSGLTNIYYDADSVKQLGSSTRWTAMLRFNSAVTYSDGSSTGAYAWAEFVIDCKNQNFYMVPAQLMSNGPGKWKYIFIESNGQPKIGHVEKGQASAEIEPLVCPKK